MSCFRGPRFGGGDDGVEKAWLAVVVVVHEVAASVFDRPQHSCTRRLYHPGSAAVPCSNMSRSESCWFGYPFPSTAPVKPLG